LVCIRQLHTRFNVPTVILSSSSIIYRANTSDSELVERRDIMLGFASHRIDLHQQSGDSQPARSGEGQLNNQISSE
uniref:DNA repair protein n=1 Tax=Echinostoma caproni TaxID=27848 RepID=A0A183A252_9TREM